MVSSSMHQANADATTCARAMFASLERPEFMFSAEHDRPAWESQEDTCLLVRGGERLWTEHSDRCFLPTWGSRCGFAKDELDRLG